MEIRAQFCDTEEWLHNSQNIEKQKNKKLNQTNNILFASFFICFQLLIKNVSTDGIFCSIIY